MSVTKKEKDTTENLLWRKRKVTRLLRFLVLSTAVAILFSLVYSDAIPLGKNRKSQVEVLSPQLFSLFTAVTGREQLTYMEAVCGRAVNLQTFLKGALMLQKKEFAESPTSATAATIFTCNLS